MKHVEEPRRAKRGNLKSVCTDFENSINRILVTQLKTGLWVFRLADQFD